jgi:SMODS and SLOG-associating 2TM effector domain 3/SMODS and SLOG-associating 2TM effector domain 1
MLSSTDILKLDSASLPSLYRAVDLVSADGQKAYFRLIAADLLALSAGSILSSFSPLDENARRLVFGASAVLFVVGFGLTIVLMQKGYEQHWYGGRAAAESVKTIAWRYSMRAEPFHSDADASIVDQQFAKSLEAILQQSHQLRLPIGGTYAAGAQVTDMMRGLRKLPLEERIASYREQRIGDQQRWYGSKAEFNKKAESRLFKAVLVVQAFAIIYCIGLVAFATSRINLSGAVATVAAALLVWLQAKQHQELAQSYAVAAHELGIIAEHARHIKTEAEFAVFVADAENAVSREHTLWTARRDKLPRLGRV